MKILAAVLAAVVVAIVGVAVFAMLNLRALIGAHQDELVARVARVVGRPITVADVVPSWWPLGVRLRQVAVGEDPAFGAEPFLVAEGAVMAIRAWPLVHGRIEAAGVVLDRPKLVLVRDGDGRWNVESLGEPAANGAAEGSAKSKERRRALRVPLEWVVGVALSQVRDGTIEIDDRLGGRALAFRHVRLRADDVRLGSQARVRIEAAVFADDAPDFRLDLRLSDLGQNDAAHAPFAATLEVVDADLAALSQWLRRPGFAGGRVRRVAVEASGTLERLRGSVELDASDAGLRVGAIALGQTMTLRASVARAPATTTVEELHATVGALVLRAHGEMTEDPWRVTLDVASEAPGAASVAIADPPIAVSAVEGRMTIEQEGLSLAPLRMKVDGAPLEARGWVTGVDPLALDVRLEGRPYGGTFVADLALDPTGTARMRVGTTGIDAGAAVGRFAPELHGRIEGKASGAAVLTGRMVGAELATGSLAGSGTVEVTGGRLRDVNLPDLVVEEIESVPLMPQLVSPRTRARYAELFGSPDTIVESASIPFTIAHGRLSTDRAVLENPAYQITGKGWIDATQELRLSGTVLLGASVSRTLRDDVRAAKYLTADDGRITLPFLARGRLSKIWVEPDAKRLRSRGLTALLGPSGDDGERAPGEEGTRENSRRNPPLEDRVIERLERMLHP